MIIKHNQLHLYGKKVFEMAIIEPPFKNLNPLPNEACFLYIIEGANNSYSEEEHLRLNTGDGVLMKCGNYMYETIPNEKTDRCGLIAVHFYPDIMEKVYSNDVSNFLSAAEKVTYQSNMAKVQSHTLITKYIESLLFYFDNPILVSEELLVLKFKEIVLLLLETKDAPAIIEIMYNLFSPRTFSFKQIIEAHIFSAIGISDLAQLCALSLSAFKREFKKVYNDTPANYIKHRRLEKAAELLRLSDQSISQIALECQFNDLAHFSNSFKKKYNQAPSDYRSNLLHK